MQGAGFLRWKSFSRTAGCFLGVLGMPTPASWFLVGCGMAGQSWGLHRDVCEKPVGASRSRDSHGVPAPSSRGPSLGICTEQAVLCTPGPRATQRGPAVRHVCSEWYGHEAASVGLACPPPPTSAVAMGSRPVSLLGSSWTRDCLSLPLCLAGLLAWPPLASRRWLQALAIPRERQECGK